MWKSKTWHLEFKSTKNLHTSFVIDKNCRQTFYNRSYVHLWLLRLPRSPLSRRLPLFTRLLWLPWHYGCQSYNCSLAATVTPRCQKCFILRTFPILLTVSRTKYCSLTEGRKCPQSEALPASLCKHSNQLTMLTFVIMVTRQYER
jgi:hypothetical protein